MTEFTQAILLGPLIHLLLVLGGVLVGCLGYILIRLWIFNRVDRAAIVKEMSLALKSADPGICFAILGAVIISAMLLRGIDGNIQTPEKLPGIRAAWDGMAEVPVPTRAPSQVATLQDRIRQLEVNSVAQEEALAQLRQEKMQIQQALAKLQQQREAIQTQVVQLEHSVRQWQWQVVSQQHQEKKEAISGPVFEAPTWLLDTLGNGERVETGMRQEKRGRWSTSQ
jgi:hypothetical protein